MASEGPWEVLDRHDLLAEVDHLKHRLDAANGQAKEAVALYQETRSERDRLQAAVDAVMELHKAKEIEMPAMRNLVWCSHCPGGVNYPCPTIQALGEGYE